MKRIVIYLLIISCLACKSKEKEFLSIIENQDAQLKLARGLFNFVVNKEIIEYNLEGLTFPDTLSLINLNGNRIIINELLSQNKKLLFFVFDYRKSCEVCIDEAIAMINLLVKTNNKIKVLVVSNFESRREMLVFNKKISESGIALHLFNYGTFFKDISNYYPLFFIYDKDKKIKMVYVHDTVLNSTTTKYLDIISDKYFSQTSKEN
ncbi:MAG: hypothetical protein MUF15_26965 [Acidobacteria bacterium]|nr:hypothetical protein [Acidobacteriota bacterium]